MKLIDFDKKSDRFKVSKYIVKSVIPSNGNSRAGDTSGIGESPSKLLSFGEKPIRIRRVKVGILFGKLWKIFIFGKKIDG